MHQFSKKEYLVLAGAAILLLPALLLNLGLVPLYGEEPRRAVVAMEMMFRDNWIVPTINGELYFLKPPFYNWILAAVYTNSGSFSEFTTRLPSVVSLLLLGAVIYFTGRKYVNKDFGMLSAILFLVSAGNLFFNSLLAEIDSFYSLVTYTSLMCLFHFQRQQKYYLLFLTVYFLGAIGTLTKGAPSLIFTGLSILVFFIVNREFRKLFSLPHLAGILVFLATAGGYFLAYHRQGDLLYLLENLSNESGKRFSGDTAWDYLIQLAWYPLDTLSNLLPGSLLIIFAVRRDFLRILKGNPLVKFAALMFAVHFPVYWLPPDSRQRYILMLYPFIIQGLVYFYMLLVSEERGKAKWMNIILIVATGLMATGSLAALFADKLGLINGLVFISLSSFAILSLIFIFQLKSPQNVLIGTILALVILRIFFNFTILPVRASEGKAYNNKKAALELDRLIGNQPVLVFRSTYFPMQCTYYLERERKEILPRYYDLRPGYYHIVQKVLLTDYSFRREIGELMKNPLMPSEDPFSGGDADIFSGFRHEVVKEFDIQKRDYILVRPL